MSDTYNIGNSIFHGFNDKNGIFLCGYEWGYSKKDEEEDRISTQFDDPNCDVVFAFSNKETRYGSKAKYWKYDQRIIQWFELWGHPLRRDGMVGDFEKCLLQTNWCNDQNHHIDSDYYTKLLDEQQIENFILHVRHFKPKLILLFGSKIIDILQNEKVLPRFKEIMGEIVVDLYKLQKDADGRQFNIGFQDFEKCKIVCLPHPTGSHGLQNDYIQLFNSEIGELIQEIKYFRNI